MLFPFLNRPFCLICCAGLLAGAGSALAQTGTPVPATAQAAPNPAVQYVRAHAADFGLADSDLADVALTSSYTDPHNGLTHAYFVQQLAGRPVAGTEVGLHFGPTGQLLARTGAFVGSLRARVALAVAPAIGATAATETGIRHLHQPNLRIAQPASLVYRRQATGALAAAWQLELRPAQGPDAWTVVVDAATGRVLKAHNRIIREPKPLGLVATALAPTIVGRGGAAGQAQPTVANSYRVFAAPLESPLHGAASVLVSPADAVASPFGWHDTNGVAGPEFTITRGNNVHVYVPANAHTSAPGFSPDGGANLEFDFPYNAALSAQDNQPAALTNVFYWTNLLHDLSKRYGFSEASGNFQATNYTGLGVGGDYLRVRMTNEYSTAYFDPTPDGATATNFPSMVLGIWQPPVANGLTVTAPAAAAGSYAVLPATFGRPLPYPGSIGAALVLVNDGSRNPTQGCQTPWTNAAQVRGNIAVLDETFDCSYENQLRNAQLAGAKAVVLVSSADFLIHLDFNPADTVGLRIPLVMITRTDGQRLKAGLQNGATATGQLGGVQPAPDRNGGFDNGVVAHEYAHGITLRLTGGPAGATACLDNAEQMGEGWSDFFELWMTTRPGDVGGTARGLGPYLLGQPTTGPGVRPLPYSTAFSSNNTTYGFIGHVVAGIDYGPDGYSSAAYDPHLTGMVWCSALWDLNWAMIQRYGYDANLLTGTGGNNKAMQLVMDGLKLQPCSPGFLDGRDAILAADRAAFGGANQALIWQVFARRGMGVDAVQGSSDDLLDNSAGFLVPGALATTGALAPAALDLYPNPTHGQLTLRLAQGPANSGPVQVAVQSLLGQAVRSRTFSAAAAAAGTTLDLGGLAPGIYLVRVTAATGSLTRRVVVQP